MASMRNLSAVLLEILFLVAVCGAAPSTKQPELTNDILKNTFSVFTLTEAQNRSLDAIGTAFPDLRQDATMARIEFDQAFAPAINAVDEFLTQNSTPDCHWPTIKKEQITAALGHLDFSGISREQAVDYISTVRKRTKGDMPQRIYNVLVTFHPVYQADPHMEIVNGYFREYTSDGTGKALELRVSLEYPMSWTSEEGRRPHILQKFSSPDALASFMIYVNEVPLVSGLSSDEENLEYLSSKEYIEKEMRGATFLSAGRTVIAGRNASFCDTLTQRSAPAGDVTLRARIYYILHRKRIVSLSFDVASPGISSPDDMEPAFKRYEKLFELVATSLDFLDKYATPAESATAGYPAEELDTSDAGHEDIGVVVTKSGKKPLPAFPKAFGETWLKVLLMGMVFAVGSAIWARTKPKKKTADRPNNRIENDEE